MISQLIRAPRRVAAFASLLVLAVVASACGSTEPQSVPIEQTRFADTLHVDLTRSTKLASGMYVRDSVVGTGAAAAVGSNVSVRYAGYLANGSRFDQGVFPFKLGAGQAIPGFDIGIQGMKVGGKRQLIIPPELGYGAAGQGPIPPYAVLVFIVDLVSAS